MSAPTFDDLSRNALLATLSETDRRRLMPHMMVFEMKNGDILQESGEEVIHTWFPCGPGMAAFCIATHDHTMAVEVALVGREGAIGGIVSNGHVPAYATAQVRYNGRFMRIRTSALEQLKLDSISLRHWFSRYSDCLLAQVFQTAACNATHTISQRTAKWLIAAIARTGDREFAMTQSQLAEMLGVGRTFVTRVVSKLRQEGIIGTRRGMVIVKNEQALHERSCTCTTAIEEHFDTVLHGIYPVE